MFYLSAKTRLLLFIAVISLLIFSGFSVSVIMVLLFLAIGVYGEMHLTNKFERIILLNLLCMIIAIYMITAIFTSNCFADGNYFLVTDPLDYFSLLNLKEMDWDPGLRLASCYLLLSDGNELHELFVRYCILFSNNYLDGASVIYLTLINVFWGVLACAAVYRILTMIMPPTKAYRYTLIFALLSPFHIYSTLFVRDIIIAFFYAHAIEIILKTFKLRNLILLFLMAFIVWGIRLYSGLFLFSLILYYVFVSFAKTRILRYFAISLSLIMFVAIVPNIKSSAVYASSSDQLERSKAFSDEHSSESGLSRSLEKLPTGAKEISMCLFTQMMPFPCYIAIPRAETISQLYVSIFFGIFGIFWYMVFYGLLFMIFIYSGYKALSFNEYLLLSVIAIFLVLNLAHVDVRRIMCIYPLIYYLYFKIQIIIKKRKKHKMMVMNKALLVLYIFLVSVYSIVK